MARRDNDIFKKLNKETPLVRRKDLQPLSPRDFTPHANTFDKMIETKEKQRSAAAPEKHDSDNERSAARKKTVYKSRRAGQRTARTDTYASRRQTGVAGERQRAASESRPVHGLDIFAEKTQVRTRPEVSPKLDIFTEKTHKLQDVSMPRAGEGHAHRSAPQPGRAVKTAAGKTLSFRHELKYYINYRDYTLLKNMLKSLLSVDAYAGDENSYYIRSLYFDDIYESAVKEKMAGSNIRSKYRIRIYNFSDDVIKFEKKMKDGQYIAKKDILLSRAEYDRIIAGDYDFLKDRNEALASEIFLEMKNNLLRPRVLVDYVREAYISPFENVRITFDKDIRGGLMLADIFDPCAPVMPILDSGIMVLEIKFNRYLPEYIRCVLNSINAAERSAISKYVLCRKYD